MAAKGSAARASGERESLNLRIKEADRSLIDRAAKALGQTRTAFVLEAARRAAEDALVERTMLLAGAPAYAKFLERLDAIPRPNARLRKSMRTSPPWSEDDDASRT